MKKFFKLFIIVIFLMQFPVYAFAEESTAESLANTITFSQDELNSRFSTGTGHSAFIDNNHNLWTWGYNWNGELGYGDRNEPDSIWPRKSISNVKAVSSGDRCTGVIKSDGSLYTFGINDYGQLGNGSSGKYNYSDALNNKVLTNVKQVSMGEYHSVAVTNDGQLYVWGLNNFGQLGKGTTDETKDDLYPTPVFSNVKYAYAGDRCTAVITNDNSLYMFGVNFHGRCGIGNQEFSAVPVKILDNVKSVSLGSSHSAAVTNDGNLYTWGSSYEYELCDGPSNERATNIPGKVMSNVKEVACGASFTVVLLNDGSVLTCGDNFNGKCGTGTDDYTIKKPTKILDGMTHILANNMHALSVGDDGSLWTWGQDLGVSHEHYYSDNGSYSPYRLIKGFKPFSSSWKEPSETKTFKVKTEVNPLGADKYITGDREYKYHETAAVSSNNIIRKFIGWYDGDVLVSKNSLYLFVVTEDVNLTAKYEPIESDLHPPLNGISFETTNLNLEIGQTSQLKVNYDPENAENKNLSWFSTNNSVATVKDGVVKGVVYC